MNNPILITIIGIVLNVIGITFNFYYLNIIGGVICVIGLFRHKLDIRPAKKARTHALLSIPFAALSIAFTLLTPDAPDGAAITLGINVFFFIYFTYYYTDALIVYAKNNNELAATRNFRSVWTLCGIIAFVYFMLVFMSLIPIVVTISRVVFLLSGLYYCLALKSTAHTLYH